MSKGMETTGKRQGRQTGKTKGWESKRMGDARNIRKQTKGWKGESNK